jgi:hypothetical protein
MIKGKAYGMGLGPLHSVTLAQARHKAANARRQLVEGINPLEERRRLQAQKAVTQARSMSFETCSAQYIAPDPLMRRLGSLIKRLIRKRSPSLQ